MVKYKIVNGEIRTVEIPYDMRNLKSYVYFDTWNAAKIMLVKLAQEKVSRHFRNLNDAQEELQKIIDMRHPDDEAIPETKA